MNVFSGFNGINCAMLALESMGIKPNKFYSSEVDKYANQACQAMFPDTIQMGDITNWREWGINWSSIDLVVGGSPCQGFSFAGKQLAFDDPRSKLFFVWLDILNHVKSVNPKVKFLLENVRMKKEYLAVISEKLGVEPICINSALVSAQNRVRYYWCNWHVEQPEDKGILLRDILEAGEHSINSSGWHDWFEKNKEFQLSKKYSAIVDSNNKAITMAARQYASWNGNFVKVRPCEPKPFSEDSLCHHDATASDIKGHGYNKRVYAETGKGPSLAAASGGNLEPKVLLVNDNLRVKGITESKEGYRPHRGDKASSGISELGRISKPDSKTNALTTSHMPKAALNIDVKNLAYRKLTPRECGRLQTVSEQKLDILLSAGISNSQLYKMFGNGWTVDVIAHIFSSMELPVQVFARQLELFEAVA